MLMFAKIKHTFRGTQRYEHHIESQPNKSCGLYHVIKQVTIKVYGKIEIFNPSYKT